MAIFLKIIYNAFSKDVRNFTFFSSIRKKLHKTREIIKKPVALNNSLGSSPA